jgi:hypothetical protein
VLFFVKIEYHEIYAQDYRCKLPVPSARSVLARPNTMLPRLSVFKTFFKNRLSSFRYFIILMENGQYALSQ